MQVVMWTILVLFVTSMAIGGLVGGASLKPADFAEMVKISAKL